MTVRVGIDLTCLEAESETGVERYARRLAETLPLVAPELTVFVIVREGRTAPRTSDPSRVVTAPSRLGRALFREVAIPRIVEDLGLHVLHAPVAAVTAMTRVPRVVTIHDLPQVTGFFGEEGRLSRHRLRALHALGVARAIITPSQATRDALLELDPRAAGRMVVIPHGVDEDFRPIGPPLDRRRYQIPEGPFILVVGTVRARKQPEVAIDAVSELIARGARDLRLVFAGRADIATEPLMERARARGIGDRVVFTGYVGREDLPDLYREASVVALPSRLEGFGLPLIEAMATGAPVVASRVASIPEVVGDAALLVPPGDAFALAEALESVLDDPALRATLRARGIERARDFTWSAAARRHADLYREIARAPVGL